MNHDIWCADIDGDGKQEIFVANANGSLTCLDISGEKKWVFTPHDSVHRTPMYSVCVVKRDNKPYVVCGDFLQIVIILMLLMESLSIRFQVKTTQKLKSLRLTKI